MSEETAWLRSRQSLWEPLELDDEQILEAYYDTFTHGPGLIVLKHLYDGLTTIPLAGVQDLGKLAVYQGIRDNILRYDALRRQRHP